MKDEKDKAAAAAPAEAEPVTITLTEFCLRLSKKVRRPEAISAFESVRRNAGDVSATEEAFQARFDLFLKQPV